MAPDTVFTTLTFIFNLRMSPIGYCVQLHWYGKACKGQMYNLLGPFVSYQENEVL